MSVRQRYVDLVARLIPMGAVGVTLLLGSALPSEAREQPLDQQPNAATERVSDRLAAIREAVSAVVSAEPAAGEVTNGQQFVQWGNGGWNNWRNGWNNWHNWHNWHNW